MPGSRDTRGRSSGQLATINPNAAGLDVGSTFHVVAVPAGRDDQPVRTFRTFSGDLHRLADWLEETGITTVAMESTSVYWIPVFEILEARGFEVLLVNAREVKHVAGRKTDVQDAQWLQQLHHSMDCCVAASGRAMGWYGCAPTCAIANAWWNTPPPTFNTCRRHETRSHSGARIDDRRRSHITTSPCTIRKRHQVVDHARCSYAAGEQGTCPSCGPGKCPSVGD